MTFSKIILLCFGMAKQRPGRTDLQLQFDAFGGRCYQIPNKFILHFQRDFE